MDTCAVCALSVGLCLRALSVRVVAVLGGTAVSDPTSKGVGGAPNDCAKDTQGAREAVGHSGVLVGSGVP